MSSYLQDIPAYVYKITCIPTGQYYYGSRYSHNKFGRKPEEDIWIHYFTSSQILWSLIDLYGKDQFIAQVIYTDLDPTIVFWFEQDYIKAHIEDDLCVNKHYINKKDQTKILSTHGTTTWLKDGRIVYSKLSPGEGWINQGRPQSTETRSKISAAHKGSPKSASHRQKLSEINTGRTTLPCRESTKQKIRKRNTGLKWYNNGETHVFVHECPGEGWIRGALPKFTAEGMERHKANRAGRVYWHNGLEQKMVRECPGPEWVRGRLYYRGKKVSKVI